MRLKKHSDGSVDPDETCNILKKEFIGDNKLTLLTGRVGHCQWLVQGCIDKDKTLIISCGEPIALKVASDLGCKGIIVTDHLLTFTIRRVLENGGLLNAEMARLMTTFEGFDRLPREAFLSPVEFASPEYIDYLAQGGLPCIPISGLFYDPIDQTILQTTEPYKRLIATAKPMIPGEHKTPPIVCVFGGGGTVWDEIYYDLHKKAQSGEFAKRSFSLLLKDVANLNGPGKREVIKGQWRLYVPGSELTDGKQLIDPGKLMYWYAASSLLVARGGLAAQQFLATLLSDISEVPQMLFIEEPGHPQIESERLSLYRLGLVHTRTLRGFQKNPFDVIEESLSTLPEARPRARVRYCRDAMETLCKTILEKYFS